MLTFKVGSYKLHDLTVLYDALEAGNRAICLAPVSDKGCSGCDNRKACSDLLATKLYISTLISQATGKWGDYRNTGNTKNHP